MKKSIIIKIPKNINVVYDKMKKIIILIGPKKTRLLKVKLRINLIGTLNSLEITNQPFIKISNHNLKFINALQGTTASLIKQLLIETSYTINKKLKFVGVGYRSFEVDEFKNKLLMFKLGYSHSLYYRIPNSLMIFCLKFTKLFILGNSYQNVTQTAALIRSYKKPEPYKGKGILYETEKISLKEGKKV